MAKATPNNRHRYAKQRARVPAPVVTLRTLRKSRGITLQAICDHLRDEHGMTVYRGTISGIEFGYRGASVQMLTALADALGIAFEDIDTQYEPRRSPKHQAEVA